jgi:hypothetical protein
VTKYRLISCFTRSIFDVSGPQFDTAELDVSAFGDIFDMAVVSVIVDETNRYAQQEILKSVNISF